MRYHLRLLLGFNLHDIAEYPTLEEGIKGFDDALLQIKQEKDSNTPYTLFLVDYEKEETIKEFTSYEG